MRSFKNYFKQCGQLQLVKKFQSLAFLLILPAIGFAQTDKLSKPKLVDSRVIEKVNKGVDSNATNTYMISYNYKSGVFDKNLLKAKVGVPMVFKITDINRQAFKIDIKIRDSILAHSSIDFALLAKEEKLNEASTAVQNNVINNPSLAITDSDLISNTKSNVSKTSTNTINQISEVAEINRLIIKAAIIQDSILSINKRLGTTDINVNKVDSIKLENSKYLFEEKANRVQDSIKSLQNTLSDELMKFSEDSERYYLSFNLLKQKFDEINLLIANYNELLVICGDPNLTLETLTSSKNKLISIKESLSEAYSIIRDFDSYSVEVKLNYNLVKYNPQLSKLLNYGGLIKLYAHIENTHNIATIMMRTVKDFDLPNKVIIMKNKLSAINSPDNFEIVSQPIQIYNDVAIFDIKIKLTSQLADISAEKVFRHIEPMRGGTRLDFGLGVGGAMFGGMPTYELAVSQSSTVISKRTNSTFVPSIIGVVTLTLRSATSLALGISGGMGVDTKQGKIELSNFFAGPTLTLGRFERLNITLGASLKNINVLKSSFKAGESYQRLLTDTDIYTQSYRLGYFVAFSFNLTKGIGEGLRKLKFN